MTAEHWEDVTGCKVHAFDLPEQRKEWLEMRRSGIGASESAAILGIPGTPSWVNKVSIWHDKVYGPDPDYDEVKEVPEFVEMGNLLESRIGEITCERQGLVKAGSGLHFTVRGTRMMCTPDLLVRSQRRSGYGCLQIKNVTEWSKEKWEDQPPLWIQCQLQHELAVTGFEWGAIAVCIGGRMMRYFPIERSEVVIKEITRACAEFWERYVKEQVMPEIDESQLTAQTLKRMFGEEVEEEIQLGMEACEKLDEWERLEETSKAMEVEVETIRNWFMLQIGDGGGNVGVLPDGRAVSWKKTKRGFRSLRRSRSKMKGVS